MPSLGFSAPNLALVAYAEVDGDEGSSTRCNSGVTTSRVSDGVYAVGLPSNLQQPNDSSLVFVQAKGSEPKASSVDDESDAVKIVSFANGGGTPVNTSFSFCLWRSTITPPAGSPS
jgi:hypothetical protein